MGIFQDLFVFDTKILAINFFANALSVLYRCIPSTEALKKGAIKFRFFSKNPTVTTM